MAKYTAIGGQALIEGILMKSPEKAALAVRTPDGSIDLTDLPEKSIRQKCKLFRLPVIRGVFAFAESMIQGYHAMMLSADKSGMTDLEEEEDRRKREERAAKKGKTLTAADHEKAESALTNAVMAVGAVLGVALAIVLFMALPRLAVGGLQRLFHASFPKLLRSGIEQLIKLVVFFLYVLLVSRVKEIRRVFMYHGAEHKTIFCYEKGLPLTVENIRKQSRFHPRCGTSFLLLMILVSVILSTLVQILFPGVYGRPVLWVIVKILMIPLTCGVGFEILRACGKYDNRLTAVLSAPGLWMQRLTTKEPEDDMIEIAVAALRACEPATPDVDRPAEDPKPLTEETEELSHDADHL